MTFACVCVLGCLCASVCVCVCVCGKGAWRTPLRVNFAVVRLPVTPRFILLHSHFILNFIYAIESCKFLFAFLALRPASEFIRHPTPAHFLAYVTVGVGCGGGGVVRVGESHC